jgi:hypothetical protein
VTKNGAANSDYCLNERISERHRQNRWYWLRVLILGAVFSSDSQNIDSMQWQQKKSSSYIYQ